ncbi:MAG: alpha/beta hydrolase [Bacteroidetes bacterium]|nr:alpha/beta hydrolase [Bacteroidota bacterium]
MLSGLGADERVFKKLSFSLYQVKYIKWIEPKPDEPIEEYASRLINQIDTPQPIFIGLSFGGMMAIEIAKQIKTKKVILISSAKTKYEVPFYYRIIGKLRLHKLIPTNVLKQSNPITQWFFGTQTKEEHLLLKNILADTDNTFLTWAIDKIVNWSNIYIPTNLLHIHGTKDKILPINFIKNHIKIEEGGHFMVLNKAKEINRLIDPILDRE